MAGTDFIHSCFFANISATTIARGFKLFDFSQNIFLQISWKFEAASLHRGGSTTCIWGVLTRNCILSPVHGSCCRADCCCLLLKKACWPISIEQWGKGMWGGRRCMTSYFCCLLLSLLMRKSVSPTAGGETGAHGDSDWWCTHLVINFSYGLRCGALICNICRILYTGKYFPTWFFDKQFIVASAPNIYHISAAVSSSCVQGTVFCDDVGSHLVPIWSAAGSPTAGAREHLNRALVAQIMNYRYGRWQSVKTLKQHIMHVLIFFL